jgi:hypothetical protein
MARYVPQTLLPVSIVRPKASTSFIFLFSTSNEWFGNKCGEPQDISSKATWRSS